MKKKSIIILMAFFLFACQNKLEKKIEQKISSNKEIKNNKIETCNFDRFLKDEKVPKIAKELYHNTYKLKDDEPLILLEKLESKDKEERMFYFRAITNSYKISDGAYSEGLGNIGKEYIENKTNEFVEYFDYKKCFTDEDLRTWAKITVLEFEIIDENIEAGEKKSMAYKYCDELIHKSEKFSKNQKETIFKFTKLLKTEWTEFLRNI